MNWFRLFIVQTNFMVIHDTRQNMLLFWNLIRLLFCTRLQTISSTIRRRLFIRICVIYACHDMETERNGSVCRHGWSFHSKSEVNNEEWTNGHRTELFVPASGQHRWMMTLSTTNRQLTRLVWMSKRPRTIASIKSFIGKLTIKIGAFSFSRFGEKKSSLSLCLNETIYR